MYVRADCGSGDSIRMERRIIQESAGHGEEFLAHWLRKGVFFRKGILGPGVTLAPGKIQSFLRCVQTQFSKIQAHRLQMSFFLFGEKGVCVWAVVVE